MKRETMIDQLVEDDIETVRQAMQHNDVEYLDYILRFGIGYDKMSNEELFAQFENRAWDIEK
jgi:hypothetical protein